MSHLAALPWLWELAPSSCLSQVLENLYHAIWSMQLFAMQRYNKWSSCPSLQTTGILCM